MDREQSSVRYIRLLLLLVGPIVGQRQMSDTASKDQGRQVRAARQHERSEHLKVCGDDSEHARVGIQAIQRTMPSQARHLLTFGPILCGTSNGCCTVVSAAQFSGELSANTRRWYDLARLARTIVFVRESHSSFCAKITTADGERVALPDLRSASLPPEVLMQRMQSLVDKLGISRAVQYFSYDPRVGTSVPGQTLMPCGIPENVCSCSGETEVHVWKGDPLLPQTLAHEAVHAWLYHTKRPFDHCSGLVPAGGCHMVDQLALEAENEARINARISK